jgi:putative modified peptide
MTSSNEEKAGHPPLSDALANHLLDLLANDDAFRAVFASDPHAALLAAGLTAAQADAALEGPSCLRVTELASKESIADARDRLKHSLTSEGAHTVVFCFDAKA